MKPEKMSIFVLDMDNEKLFLTKVTELPESMYSLYLEAFPAEERRPVEDLRRRIGCAPHEGLNCTLISMADTPVGFMTWWNLGGVVYIEHFAISGDMRGRGLGERALEQFVRESTLPILLEVEPAESGAMAKRRISFYERCGFSAHRDFEYIQPPYSAGQPPVALMLMSSGEVRNLADVVKTLHEHVYGVVFG